MKKENAIIKHFLLQFVKLHYRLLINNILGFLFFEKLGIVPF